MIRKKSDIHVIPILQTHPLQNILNSLTIAFHSRFIQNDSTIHHTHRPDMKSFRCFVSSTHNYLIFAYDINTSL